jgi:hypothetical protein
MREFTRAAAVVLCGALVGCGGDRPAQVEAGLKDGEGNGPWSRSEGAAVSQPVDPQTDDRGVTSQGLDWQVLVRAEAEAVPAVEIVEKQKTWRTYVPGVDDKFSRKEILLDWKSWNPARTTSATADPAAARPTYPGMRASVHVGAVVRIAGGERRIAVRHICVAWVVKGGVRYMVVAFGYANAELAQIEREAEHILLDYVAAH